MPWQIGAVLALATLAVVAGWALTRVDSLGRTRSFPLIGVLLLGALAAGTGTPAAWHVLRERRLSVVASELAGGPVDVHCQSVGQTFLDAGAELGYVRFGPDGTPERRTLIKRDQCADLGDYLRSDKRDPPLAQVIAVHVLTHEAMHMAGLTSEAETECAAVARDSRAAELLGAAPADARALALRYWAEVYPTMPGAYRSAYCAGPLAGHKPAPSDAGRGPTTGVGLERRGRRRDHHERFTHHTARTHRTGPCAQRLIDRAPGPGTTTGRITGNFRSQLGSR